MALPDLSNPAILSLAAPTLLDPFMDSGGNVDLEALRAKLRTDIQAAATEHGEHLRADWSNIFACSNACNVLFDLNSIYAGCGTIKKSMPNA